MSDLPSVTYVLPGNTPEKAPMPAFDPIEANYFDMFAPQYYNLETVQALMKEGGGPLLLEVENVAVEYVYNPERGEDSGEWKPVVHFVGGGPALVLNQTRAKVLMKTTRSIHVGDWQRVGWLEVAAGIDNGKAQLVISPASAPGEATHSSANSVGDNGGKTAIDELNEELFG
jgi:hypothetical protein